MIRQGFRYVRQLADISQIGRTEASSYSVHLNGAKSYKVQIVAKADRASIV